MEDEASCNECTNLTQIQNFQNPLCPNSTQWKINVWNNQDTKFWSYEERMCCNVGEVRNQASLSLETVQEMMCRERNTGALLSYIFGGLGGLALVIFFIF